MTKCSNIPNVFIQKLENNIGNPKYFHMKIWRFCSKNWTQEIKKTFCQRAFVGPLRLINIMNINKQFVYLSLIENPEEIKNNCPLEFGQFMNLDVLETSQNNFDELKFNIIVGSMDSFSWDLENLFFGQLISIVQDVYWSFSLMNCDRKISQLELNSLSLLTQNALCELGKSHSGDFL